MTLVQEILEKPSARLVCIQVGPAQHLTCTRSDVVGIIYLRRANYSYLYTQTGSLKHNEQALKYDI